MENDKTTALWEAVQGYEGSYLVSSKGEVLSVGSGVLLKPVLVNGYERVRLYKDGKQKGFLVHRLVAQAFVPNPHGKATVNHINEMIRDNRAENLEWASMHEQVNYGTRTQRAVRNTDYRARSSKIDYAAISKRRMKPVVQMDLDGREISCYDGIQSASRRTGIGSGNIWACCTGKRKTAGGFQFKYLHCHVDKEDADEVQGQTD